MRPPIPTAAATSPRTSPSPRNRRETTVASEADWEDTQKTGPAEAPKSSEPPTTFEYADRSEETLRDHLLWQLELENLDARTTTIGQGIIDAINDDGYLTDDLEMIRATLAPDVLAPVEEVEKVLVELVQQFDPAGVGARSVSECVLLQLAQLAPDTLGLELARTIARRALAARRGAPIRRAQASIEGVGRGARIRDRTGALVPSAARSLGVRSGGGICRAGRVRAAQRRPLGGGAEQRGVAAPYA